MTQREFLDDFCLQLDYQGSCMRFSAAQWPEQRLFEKVSQVRVENLQTSSLDPSLLKNQCFQSRFELIETVAACCLA